MQTPTIGRTLRSDALGNKTFKVETFISMFPRSPQERVGGVGSVLLFRRELAWG